MNAWLNFQFKCKDFLILIALDKEMYLKILRLIESQDFSRVSRNVAKIPLNWKLCKRCSTEPSVTFGVNFEAHDGNSEVFLN